MTPECCIGIIERWLTEMKPQNVELVEDALMELEIQMRSVPVARARSLAGLLSRATALAVSAEMLWSAAASLHCGAGPAYSASGVTCEPVAGSALRI
jgi:hypothetical protein